MSKISIPGLVPKTNKRRVTSWFWQPSAFLRKHGFESIPLGKDEGAAIAAARAENERVELWRNGGVEISRIRKHVPRDTLAAAIAKYRAEKLHDPKLTAAQAQRDGRVAASTSKTYATSLSRLEEWAGDKPLAFVTPARVRALRNNAIENLGHDPTHKMLKMGSTLFAFLRRCDLVTVNPFENFDLAAPPPRDKIWSPPARELLIASALKNGRPSVALSFMLGFAIGQREADLLSMLLTQWVPIPEHKMQPADWAYLSSIAPDGIPMGIRVRQKKTGAWIEVPVVGNVRIAVEANIARAKAAGLMTLLFEDDRQISYAGDSQQTRFQRQVAEIRADAAQLARDRGDDQLAEEIETLQWRDLRRTAVVFLGELGLDAHLIAAITGHDIDETQRILKTYMPLTTGRAAAAIAISHARAAKVEATKKGAKG